MKLYDVTGKYYFELKLGLPIASAHDGWLSYVLSYGEMAGNVFHLDSSGLFFDNTYDIEVIMLINGMRKIAKNSGQFIFSPADDGEFLMSVSKKMEDIEFSITLVKTKGETVNNSTINFIIDTDSLNLFCNGLENEYKHLQCRSPEGKPPRTV